MKLSGRKALINLINARFTFDQGLTPSRQFCRISGAKIEACFSRIWGATSTRVLMVGGGVRISGSCTGSPKRPLEGFHYQEGPH